MGAFAAALAVVAADAPAGAAAAGGCGASPRMLYLEPPSRVKLQREREGGRDEREAKSHDTNEIPCMLQATRESLDFTRAKQSTLYCLQEGGHSIHEPV